MIIISNSNEEKLPGNLVDNKVNFESHVGSLWRKAGQKINALARLKNYLTSDQRRLLLNFGIKSQFTYCPLIWVFTLRYLNNALNNNIYEGALRLIYKDHEKSFNSILTESNLKTIHQKNLEFFAIEMYKFENGLSPSIMIIFPSQDKNFLLSESFRNFPPQLKSMGNLLRKSFTEDHNYGSYSLIT